ncbi:MAG: hypothetical protein ACREJ3_04005, partial [Polyangiaceae bacterium]
QNVVTIAEDWDFRLPDDWSDRGANGACRTTTELQKTMNSAMLLMDGVDFHFNPTFNAVTVFHSTDCNGGDYCNLVAASGDGGWHSWFRYVPADSLGEDYAIFNDRDPRFGNPDLIQMACPLYDSPSAFGSVSAAGPALRAEVLAHEAWHAWEEEHGHPWTITDCGHERCPDTNPGQPTKRKYCHLGAECDTWYPHSSSPAGSMNNGQMHRPYQVMVEFACDLVNSPQDWVPLIVRELAKADAAYLGHNDILNQAPMPECNAGFAASMINGVCPNASNQCDQETPCTGGDICAPDTGCCVPAPTCAIAGSPSCDGTCACDFTTGCCPVPRPPPQ